MMSVDGIDVLEFVYWTNLRSNGDQIAVGAKSKIHPMLLRPKEGAKINT
jgi:hypothetical protein